MSLLSEYAQPAMRGIRLKLQEAGIGPGGVLIVYKGRYSKATNQGICALLLN